MSDKIYFTTKRIYSDKKRHFFMIENLGLYELCVFL